MCASASYLSARRLCSDRRLSDPYLSFEEQLMTGSDAAALVGKMTSVAVQRENSTIPGESMISAIVGGGLLRCSSFRGNSEVPDLSDAWPVADCQAGLLIQHHGRRGTVLEVFLCGEHAGFTFEADVHHHHPFGLL